MHNIYLRRLRTRWSLSQEELAELLGVAQGRISRYERGDEHPTLPVVFALQVIFGRSPRNLVSRLYASVEEAVMRRAVVLERKVAGKKDYASVKKQHLLRAMMARATKHSDA
ncbi:hypothetical protein GCM10023232_08630 [Sphingosinicella ginsenosidimutans]|uniref:Helix-turn-helix transcriptional regulator n=1 Tax=Allosphingosinicella ginsenosidimutans TaxID=1176539 RepID=A0A5C6TW20_9SPHN|nr:helix-turn-helix transcriptional regulator [Sphingosinicella ginsenosidimutans]TXC64673.1 helix-turn-helix transcriptional regulator [Sphingosinicella ginsenosidimutans]